MRLTGRFVVLVWFGFCTLNPLGVSAIDAPMGIDFKIHKTCLAASDYTGCVYIQTLLQSSVQGKRSWTRKDGSIILFDPKSVAPYFENNQAEQRYLQYEYQILFDSHSALPGNDNGEGVKQSVRIPNPRSTKFLTYFEDKAQNVDRLATPQTRKIVLDCFESKAMVHEDLAGWRDLKGALADQSPAANEALNVLTEYCPKIGRIYYESQLRKIGRQHVLDCIYC